MVDPPHLASNDANISYAVLIKHASSLSYTIENWRDTK